MAKHHEPFKALAPIDWSHVGVPSAGTTNSEVPISLPTFLAKTFADAQTIIESIPLSPSLEHIFRATRKPRLRSHTESSTLATTSLTTTPIGDTKVAQKINREWKEAKINARDNPLDINVYKLSAKDGHGSWFARRSVHKGLSFERWKLALEREFAENMRAQPGGAKIRGMGAERRITREECEGVGRAEIYQVSAVFPGPVTPRDFVTLLLSNDSGHNEREFRQFMIVSKPCTHPDCPPRQNFIRGTYESVEMIREIPLSEPPRRSQSSIELGRDVPSGPGQEIVCGGDKSSTMAVEWLMITRSDPGGNVPRFLVERGTPSGIVTDAARFFKWANMKEPNSYAGTDKESQPKTNASGGAKYHRPPTRSASASTIQTTATAYSSTFSPTTTASPADKLRKRAATVGLTPSVLQPELIHDANVNINDEEQIHNPGNLYSVLASALETASSAVTSRLPNPFNATLNTTIEVDPSHKNNQYGTKQAENEDIDDKSSIQTFASAIEESLVTEDPVSPEGSTPADEGGIDHGNPSGEDKRVILNSEAPTAVATATDTSPSVLSKDSAGSISFGGVIHTQTIGGEQLPPEVAHQGHSATSFSISSHALNNEKELRKLNAQRQKLADKLSRIQSRGVERDSAARNKAEREAARLAAKFQKEMNKLEQKRIAEEAKARDKAERVRDKKNHRWMQFEVEKLVAERDLARKEAEMLRLQVGNLQAQNTKLVAKLGDLGESFEDI